MNKAASSAANHLRKIEMARGGGGGGEEMTRTKTNEAGNVAELGGFVIRKWNRQCMGAVAVDCGEAGISRASASLADK